MPLAGRSGIMRFGGYSGFQEADRHLSRQCQTAGRDTLQHVGRLLRPSLFCHCSCCSRAEASKKEVQYSDLPASFSFQLIAVEALGPITEYAVDFLRELGRRISSKFQEERQSAYLFQRLSVTVQRFNAVILHDSFPPSSDLWPPMEYFFSIFT